MKKLAVLAITVLLFTSCVEQTKVGYVDIEEIMKDYDAMSKMEEDLKLEQESMAKSLDSLMAPFQAKVQAYYKKAQKMSAKNRQAQEAALQQEQQALQGKQQQAQAVLQQKGQVGIEALTKKVDSAVAAYAKTNKFNLVLGTQGSGTVMYGDDNINITETVLDILNADFEAESK